MNDHQSFLDATHHPDDEYRVDARWKRYLWPIVGLLAIIVFELTASVAISSFVLCLKLGMADFLYSRWLAVHDPKRGRRRACVAFQMALGAFKVVLFGTILSVVFLVINVLTLQQPNKNFMDAALVLGITAAIGFLLSCGFALYGAQAADWGRFRIWVDRSAGHRVQTEFPPDQLGEVNELPSLFGALKLMWSLLVLTVTVLVCIKFPNLPGAVTLSVALIVWAIYVYKLDGMRARIHAAGPHQCWPEIAEQEIQKLGDDTGLLSRF